MTDQISTLLRDLVQHASEAEDHTPESFCRGVMELANRAVHIRERLALQHPSQSAGEPAGWQMRFRTSAECAVDPANRAWSGWKWASRKRIDQIKADKFFDVEERQVFTSPPPTIAQQEAGEPFVVRHYTEDEGPIIKGNGFDGLRIGNDREEAQAFIDWINSRIASPPPTDAARASGVTMERDPLSDFQEGQWWVAELDAMVKDGGTADEKRAVAVVHRLLRACRAVAEPDAARAEAKRESAKDMLIRALAERLTALHVEKEDWREAVETLGSERAANARLTEELDALFARVEADRREAELWRFIAARNFQYFVPTRHWRLTDDAGKTLHEGRAESFEGGARAALAAERKEQA